MKKTTKIVLCTLAICASTTLIASEAYTPISYGVKSQGMGGVSIANVQGAESGFANPALLSFVKSNEVSLGGTYAKQDADITANDGSGIQMYTNKEDTLSPYLCFNYHLTENLNIGAGVTDYSLKNYFHSNGNTSGTELQKRRVSIPLSYALHNFSLGATLIYEKLTYTFTDEEVSSTINDDNFGYDLGLAYNFKEIGLLIAIDYKLQIKHPLYDGIDKFDINSASEIGIGASWNILNSPHMVAVDYKRINSSEMISDVSNIETFCKDQNVFAIGYMYDAKKWQARVGYKYVSSLYTGTNSFIDVIFPFATTSHYTVGGSYMFNNSFSVDMSMLYATYNKDSYFDDDGDIIAYNVNSNPISLSLGLNYTF